MAKRPPKSFVIKRDDYHAEHVGKTAEGLQFFLTNPFVPESENDPGREFLALYLFDKDGALVEARIDDLGPRATLDEPKAAARREELLKSLGKIRYGTIKIAPFQVDRFGAAFGFIAQEPEDPDDDWSVIVEPGNYMCFWPPWSSGEYDT